MSEETPDFEVSKQSRNITQTKSLSPKFDILLTCLHFQCLLSICLFESWIFRIKSLSFPSDGNWELHFVLMGSIWHLKKYCISAYSFRRKKFALDLKVSEFFNCFGILMYWARKRGELLNGRYYTRSTVFSNYRNSFSY